MGFLSGTFNIDKLARFYIIKYYGVSKLSKLSMLNTNQNQTLTLHGSLLTRLTVFYCQKNIKKNNTTLTWNTKTGSMVVLGHRPVFVLSNHTHTLTLIYTHIHTHRVTVLIGVCFVSGRS